MQFIDLKSQYEEHKQTINNAIQRVLDHGKFIMGPEIGELEDTLSDFVGVKHCITVSSGTDALLMALMALGIGVGDEVITTPFTWISTAEVIALLGATPVFIDINPNTYNIDVNQIESAITSKTKAIIPVSLFGQMPDCEQIMKIASKYNIKVIEDAAQSFGATRNGKRSCSVTHIGATSFFPAKPFGCYGDGGALFTDDDELATTMRAIRTHGGVKRHYHTHVGINGRLDTIQAAVLLAKFPHFVRELSLKEQAADRYNQGLVNSVVIPMLEEGCSHAYAQYTIRTSKRDELKQWLQDKGIPSAIYYPKCLHEQPIFASLGYQIDDFPESIKASREVLSLPMHAYLTEEDQENTINVVLDFCVQGVETCCLS